MEGSRSWEEVMRGVMALWFGACGEDGRAADKQERAPVRYGVEKGKAALFSTGACFLRGR